MIHLAWPWMALLAPLPWLSYRWRAPADSGATLYVPMAAEVSPQRPSVFRRPRWGRWLLGLIWILMVAAAMRPQWLGEPQALPAVGRRMMLAVDVSGSMETPDMTGGASRLEVVQEVAGRFIDGRQGDRVGLILFGTRPYLQAPLSADLATVHRFLDEAVIGEAGKQTAIGDAIGLAVKRLRAEDQESGAEAQAQGSAARRTVLVLLTDGQNNAGEMPPAQAAQIAARMGLTIYTIGVGATTGGLFGLSPGNSDLDEDTLKGIAQATGGRYFRAGDADALAAVYRQIDRLEPAPSAARWLRAADEWFAGPLALALLLSVPVALSARTWT
jgi:Ca-activated chloride channel family protein